MSEVTRWKWAARAEHIFQGLMLGIAIGVFITTIIFEVVT